MIERTQKNKLNMYCANIAENKKFWCGYKVNITKKFSEPLADDSIVISRDGYLLKRYSSSPYITSEQLLKITVYSSRLTISYKPFLLLYILFRS